VRARIPLAEGQILNNSLLQAGLDFVETDYGRKGYLYISTNRIIDRKPGNVGDITIRVSEDKPYRIDRLEFGGNTVTRDWVLRREMRVNEEDLLDIQRLRLGLRRINQLGFFQIQKEPEIEPIEGTDTVKVRIEGIEQRRSELQVGGGYSGLDGGFFTANYQTRNFLGRGNLVTFNAQAGAISTRYILSFTEPYFLGKPLLFGFSIFKRTTDFVDFDTDSGGGSLTLGWRFKVFHSISAAYLFQDTNFDPVTGFSSQTRTSSLRPSYSYNTINNFFRPSRGFRALATFQFAGGPLGGDNYFIKPIVRMTKYLKAWKGTHWAFHGEAGYVGAFDDRRLPTFERFFLGGERSLRIFETRTIAPEGFISRFFPDEIVFDPDDCPAAPGGQRHSRQTRCDIFLAGGNKMMLVNAEYVIPTEGPVDFAVFLDAGNAFHEKEKVSFSGLRFDAGVEVRFFLPIFGAPLRLIYGFNLDPEEGEDRSNFVFSVGTTF
jgi:outer membrane protein insertion porin family